MLYQSTYARIDDYIFLTACITILAFLKNEFNSCDILHAVMLN